MGETICLTNDQVAVLQGIAEEEKSLVCEYRLLYSMSDIKAMFPDTPRLLAPTYELWETDIRVIGYPAHIKHRVSVATKKVSSSFMLISLCLPTEEIKS